MPAVLLQIQVLAVVAALPGAIAGWVGALRLQDLEAATDLSASVQPLLVLLLPITLVVTAGINLKLGRQALYRNLKTALTLECGAGALGALLGNGLFWLISIYLLIAFGKMDAALVQSAVLAKLSLGWSLAAVISTVLMALPTALWLHRLTPKP